MRYFSCSQGLFKDQGFLFIWLSGTKTLQTSESIWYLRVQGFLIVITQNRIANSCPLNKVKATLHHLLHLVTGAHYHTQTNSNSLLDRTSHRRRASRVHLQIYLDKYVYWRDNICSQLTATLLLQLAFHL